MKRTNCECPLAGYCNRHGVDKSNHLHKLCETNIRYFNMWENCRGPGQHFVDCNNAKEKDPLQAVAEPKPEPEPKKEPELPSLKEQAKNFIKSAVSHVANGMQNVTPELQEQRLSICSGCEYLIKDEMRCSACGCFLNTKTKWKTSSCPKGKW